MPPVAPTMAPCSAYGCTAATATAPPMMHPETAPRPAELCASASPRVLSSKEPVEIAESESDASGTPQLIDLCSYVLFRFSVEQRLNEANEGACLPVFSRPALFIEGLSSRKRGKTVPNLIEPRSYGHQEKPLVMCGPQVEVAAHSRFR